MITQQEKEAFLHREYCYLARLSELERELHRERKTSSEIQAAFDDSRGKASLRLALVDPVVNMEILLLREKLRQKEEKIESLQDEISSSSFDPKSICGQKLMKKCRALLEENQDLGRQLAEEKFQDLTVLVKTEKKKVEQLREKMREQSEFCSVLDDENEKLQCAYQLLQQKLKAAEADNVALRTRFELREKEREKEKEKERDKEREKEKEKEREKESEPILVSPQKSVTKRATPEVSVRIDDASDKTTSILESPKKEKDDRKRDRRRHLEKEKEKEKEKEREEKKRRKK